MTKWKGQEDFIHLVAQLKKHKANVHALIVGETKRQNQFSQKLQKKAQSLGVCENVTFVGHRDDLREIMAISSIVYSLSLEPEAFGRTTIEALSLGVPVIGYAHGGVQEQLATLLPEGQIDVGNVAEAATLTLRWLDQPPDVAKNQAFSLDTMLQKTMDVYQELAQAGQRGAD